MMHYTACSLLEYTTYVQELTLLGYEIYTDKSSFNKEEDLIASVTLVSKSQDGLSEKLENIRFYKKIQ